jgi:hypothetical protein
VNYRKERGLWIASERQIKEDLSLIISHTEVVKST